MYRECTLLYHGSSPGSATSIIREGFRPSTVSTTVHGMLLGQGVYVSRDIRKAMKYGKVVLKLLVYPGKTCHILTNNRKILSTWQDTHDSAWIPPLSLTASGLEETCVKDPSNIMVLGVVMGAHLLEQGEGFQCLECVDRLTNSEGALLAKFRNNLKLGYFYLKHKSTGKILSSEPKSRMCTLVDSLNKSTCTCYALWCWEGGTGAKRGTAGGNLRGTLCSKLTGRILTIKAEVEGMWLGKVTCHMADYGINFPVWTEDTAARQVVRAGGGGELLHEASGQFLSVVRDVNNNQGWVGLSHARDYWDTLYCGLCSTCDI